MTLRSDSRATGTATSATSSRTHEEVALTPPADGLARLGQPVRFVLVGTGGYFVNLGVFAALVGGGLQYAAAAVISYIVSNALMYLGNRYFTFRLGNEGFWSAYLRYLTVGLVVVALNTLVLALLVEVAAVDETLAQALSLLAVTPVAFVLFKRWTFRLRAGT